MRTWTGPHRVSIESPVIVLLADALAALDVDVDGDGDGDELDGAGVVAPLEAVSGPVAVTAGRADTAVEPLVLKVSSSTRPVMVPNRAAMTRFMAIPFQASEVEGFVVDLAAWHLRRAECGDHGVGHRVGSADVDVVFA